MNMSETPIKAKKWARLGDSEFEVEAPLAISGKPLNVSVNGIEQKIDNTTLAKMLCWYFFVKAIDKIEITLDKDRFGLRKKKYV